MVAFQERGKPEYPEKNLSEHAKGENQQQSQPKYTVYVDVVTRWETSAFTILHHPCSLQRVEQ